MSELEHKLDQLYEQGVVKETAKQRVLELKEIEKLIPQMKKDKQLNNLLKLHKALANKNRLLILWLIINGVRCACEIEHLLNLSQSTVSHHINTLVEVDAIESIKSGKWNLVKSSNFEYSKELFIKMIEKIFE
jgi:ArsR family transcriptional regulator